MEEHSGTDEAQGRWTQIEVGEVVFDRGTEWEDAARVYLWRRVPNPIPHQLREEDYGLQIIVDWQMEQHTFSADQAERLADELPALLRRAAARARAD